MRTNTDANEDMTRTKLIRLPEVRRRVPLSRSTIYLLASKGEFPKPVSIGPRAVAWVESEVDASAKAKIGGVCSGRRWFGGVRVLQLGNDPSGPKILRPGNCFKAWTQANGELPRKRQEMSPDVFREGQIYTIDI